MTLYLIKTAFTFVIILIIASLSFYYFNDWKVNRDAQHREMDLTNMNYCVDPTYKMRNTRIPPDV